MDSSNARNIPISMAHIWAEIRNKNVQDMNYET